MGLSPGTVINGKYRVLRLLGDGGMGSVYEAHHEVLGTRVALKMLHVELSRTGIAKRFLQEARASARIKSRYVVGVSDADQTPEGHAFIVLEFLEGRTLREVYETLDREGKRLPLEDALELAMQMFDGVEAAHAAGIVHRDLKPDNVMLTQDPKGGTVLKLLDFGIAKVDDAPDTVSGKPSGPGNQALTRPGALLGTPEYMAPEQVYSANSADVRSDIFSLGVMLFEMLSGRRPVLSDDPQQIAVSYLTGAFTQLSDICPDLPPGLAQAVHHALAAQPRDRFATVMEMRSAIEPFVPGRPASNTGARLSTIITALPTTSLVAALPPAPPPEPPKPRPLVAPAPARRSIPETNVYPSGIGKGGTAVLPSTPPPPGPASGTAPTQNEEEAAITRSANIPRIEPSEPPRASPGGPAFAPDYPSAMGPFSGPVGSDAPQASRNGTALLPQTNPAPPMTDPASGIPLTAPLLVPPNPPLPPVQLAQWSAPSQASTAVAPPRPSRTGLWAAIALVLLLLGAGITVGVLYYQGWLDPDPAPSSKPPPHKPPTAKPHPTTAPTPRHTGGQLR